MRPAKLDSHQKAFQINMDLNKYGTFAEIGAGQEVARAFFRVGGAAGTIAKTISAYDMTFSDAIYGPCERYVSRQRLQTMLDYEYELLLERLNAQRGNKTTFFVFADTVTARSYTRLDDAHGWMGIQFQTRPQSPPSQIIIHVRMLDRDNVQEQEALGTIGVNLIYGAFYLHTQPEEFIRSLSDNLTNERIEVDMVKLSGPDFFSVDNRLMSLQLVQEGLTNAAMFTADGEVVQPAEVLYQKSILVERGSFRPVNLLNLDMLNCARDQFIPQAQVGSGEVVELMEITTRNLLTTGVIDHHDFLARVDLLGALGKSVLISNYSHFYRLTAHLANYTKKMIGIAVGIPALKEIFNEKYYIDLEGGILEAFGRLFKNAVKIYVYPYQEDSGQLISASDLQVASNLRHLYSYLLENHHLVSLHNYNQELLPIHSQDVLEQIRNGAHGWEKQVPPDVAQLIKQRRFFGWRE